MAKLLTASAKLDKEGRLVLVVNNKEVRRTEVNHLSSYSFKYKNKEYNFIFDEEKGKSGAIWLYPAFEFKKPTILL